MPHSLTKRIISRREYLHPLPSGPSKSIDGRHEAEKERPLSGSGVGAGIHHSRTFHLRAYNPRSRPKAASAPPWRPRPEGNAIRTFAAATLTGGRASLHICAPSSTDRRSAASRSLGARRLARSVLRREDGPDSARAPISRRPAPKIGIAREATWGSVIPEV